jgi:hypothetical protein
LQALNRPPLSTGSATFASLPQKDARGSVARPFVVEIFYFKMIFTPKDRCFTFEIPDNCWNDAGMSAFRLSGLSYVGRPDPDRPSLPVIIVPIAAIRRGPRRRKGGDFDERRMLDILHGIARGAGIPAIAIKRLPDSDARFSHELYDGFHRFSASIAAGYTHIPAVVVDEEH